MNTIQFLYENRERPKNLKRGFVLLAKRVLLFIPLLKIIFKRRSIVKRGGQVGPLSIISGAKIRGQDLSRLQIGEQTSIGNIEIALHDKVIIGSYVVINDGSVLLTGTHRLSDPTWPLKTAPITIKDYAWIATNAIILPGVKIGRGAVVGAGSVVREDIPDNAIVFGNPAKIIKNRIRSEYLNYSPTLLNAPFEAWVGKK